MLYPSVEQVTAFSDATSTKLGDLTSLTAAYDALVADEESLQEDIEAAAGAVSTKLRELELLGQQIGSTFNFYDNAAAPIILAKTPLGAAADVPASVAPVVIFSVPLDPATVIAANIFLDRVGGADPAVTLTLDELGCGVTITPDAPLVAGATYQIVVTTSVLGLNGLAFQEKYVQAVAWTVAS